MTHPILPSLYRPLGRIALALGLLAGSLHTAEAWWVYNESGIKVRAKILNMEGGNTDCGDWDDARGREIAANSADSANFASKNCNPTQKRHSTFLLQLLIEGDNNGNLSKSNGYFQCFLKMRGDGYARLMLQPRPNFTTPVTSVFGYSIALTSTNPYCAAYFEEDMNHNSRIDAGDVDINADGRYTSVVVDYNDYFARSVPPAAVPAMTPANRDVRFLITGDPQYYYDPAYQNRNAKADTTLKAMTNALNGNKQIRGIIISGDLTQTASELDTYKSAIADAQHFVFEGLGNHDIEDNNNRSNPDKLRKYVGEKARATAPTLRFKSDDPKSPHYSWDWHDVHFVQLDLFPGDAPSDDYDGSKDGHKKLDPRKALAFLQADLLYYVGNSGRPVVLVHHYGFDDFSTGTGPDNEDEIWWNESDRQKYWNAIRNYNVVAIFYGHNHMEAYDYRWKSYSFRQPVQAFDRPDGRSSIPAYNAAATLAGAYLDVTLDRCNRLQVVRKDASGKTWANAATSFTAPGTIGAGCAVPAP